MSKIDFKKELRHLYNPSAKQFTTVDVPAMQFLMIDGMGDPGTAPAYVQAVETLYAVAYKLRFASKNGLGKDYTVPPLEGLWWADDMAAFTDKPDRDAWLWTAMIMTPEWITSDLYAQTVATVQKAKNPPALNRLRLDCYHEGLSLQILHLGSFADEAPVLRRLHHEFMPAQGYAFNGKHHEIYLSDPRRVAPEKLRTVLRQPVKKA